MSFPRPTFLRTAAVLVAAISIGWNSAAPGQEQETAPPKTKPKSAAAKPRADAKAPAASAPLTAAELGPPEDPVVLALLASNPTTPSEIFHTAESLLNASRPELAKQYLKKLLDAKLDDGQWAALVDEYHTTAFAELAERTELRPESELLFQAALGAADRRSHDPALLAEEIKQLRDPSPEVRDRAIEKLRQAHTAAVCALIAVLADPQRTEEHAAVRRALVALRGDAIDPLVGILQRAEPELTIEAIRALSEMRAAQAIAYLYVPALAEPSNPRVRASARAALAQLHGALPSSAEAAQQLYDLARSYYAGKQPLGADLHGRVTLWTWDAAAKQCVAESYAPDAAARALTVRLARAALSLSSGSRAAETLAAAAELEQMVYDRGLDKPLDFNDVNVKRLAAMDLHAMDDVLTFCLNEHHPAGARAAAEILGRVGNAGALLRGSSGPSPLVRAARNPDARVRMAALDAITALHPVAPFPGSSFVTEALAFQAGSTGGRRALIVSPNMDTLQQWIGVLKFRNIEPDLVSTGNEAVRMAWRCPDYELMVIDMTAQSPLAEEIVQRLHSDYRTATLRIALVARSGYLERAERIAAGDPLTVAFSRPIDAAAARWQLAQLNKPASREIVGFSERQALAVRALDCLAKLSSAPAARRLFDIGSAETAVLAGLSMPRLSGHAIIVLANLGTRASQQALADSAGRTVNPLPLRQSAATAFNVNVQQFGLLLSQDSVRRQYRLYQQSASLDPDGQQILAAVLGTIESRAAPSALQAAQQASRAERAAPPRKLTPLADKKAED